MFQKYGLPLFLCTVLFVCTTISASVPEPDNFIEENAISFNGVDLPGELFAETANKKIVLFGEGHGIKELPQYFYLVVEELSKSQPIVVGLEFPEDLQPDINAFFQTGNTDILQGLPFFTDSNEHSGRASAAMIGLLVKLRMLKNITPFCFDVSISESSSENRDTLMAENVVEKAESTGAQPIILLTGNIHSRLTPGVPWDPEYATMGAEILRLSETLSLANVTNVLFRYSQGSAWQCRAQGNEIHCDAYTFGPSKSPYAVEVDDDYYFLKEAKLTDGHLNSFFIREVEASSPYF